MTSSKPKWSATGLLSWSGSVSMAYESPAGTTAVPQLRITVGYRVPAGDSYAIDTFPDQLSKPVADHFDFEDVMPPDLMRQVVECINGGRTC